jgi:hypothetical protein
MLNAQLEVVIVIARVSNARDIFKTEYFKRNHPICNIKPIDLNKPRVRKMPPYRKPSNATKIKIHKGHPKPKPLPKHTQKVWRRGGQSKTKK